MSESAGKLYAIGDRNDGVLYVITNPFRVAKVDKSEIQDYADAKGKSFDEAFGNYARATMKAIVENDYSDVPANVEEVLDAFEHKVANGSTISDADFCFVADVKLDDLTANRSIYRPVQNALENLIGENGAGMAESNSSLRDIVEKDE